MRPLSSPRMHVVRKEEKEARLKAFVAEQLQVLSAERPGDRAMTVIARGVDSPVLKALAAESKSLTEAGIYVRAIVVQHDGAKCPDVSAFLSSVSCRVGCDPRLLDAHEQLVIGDHIAWVGDCMRREPMKRDAYECYSPDCRSTAAFARRSFERVWTFARATKITGPGAPEAAQKPASPVEVALAALAEGESAPLVSTRH